MSDLITEIKTDCATCRLRKSEADILLTGDCKLFECLKFRNEHCRKKMAFEIINSQDSIITQTWFDDSNFIVHITHKYKTLDDIILLLNKLIDIWGNLEGDGCDCPFEDVIKELITKISAKSA
ncbi:MAG: hypothetical protein AB7E76_09450 [Deferribacterales bacterium]